MELSNRFGWHSPFWVIGGFGILVGIAIVIYMKPITAHLLVKHERSAFRHLAATVSKPEYLRAFMATTLLATGGFMMMPFGSAFSTGNLGLLLTQLPMLYFVTGLSSFITGPLVGKLSDKIGRYKVFVMGSAISALMVIIYTNLGVTPLWIICALNVILFAGIMSRLVASSALISAIPDMRDRGAFMSINSSVQQIAGGIAAGVAGLIVVQTPSGKLEHYPVLGYVVIVSMMITAIMVYFLDRFVQRKLAAAKQAPVVVSEEAVIG